MNPNQWQQPQQTGYQYGSGGMMPQRTGFPGGPPQAMGGGFNAPQMTGMGGMQGMGGQLTPMMTGMPSIQQRQAPPPPPMPSMQTGNYGFLNAPPPAGSFGSAGLTAQRTGFPGGGLQPQATGWQGGLTAQPTGMPHDPRLQVFMGSLMPGNTQGNLGPSNTTSTTSTFNSQFPPMSTLARDLPINASAPLTQNFQSLLSNPNVATPKVPWTLSKQEKKDYDQIFRAWTGGSGGGFIEGNMAQEVFGQSGLGRDDLMKIWNLSDINNRGKLNLPEFHVAMGLIYRALNGNQIPDELPAEMVPPSMRDIDSTVDFVKDLLRNDSSNRNSPSPAGFDNMPGTFGNRAKADATVYKHDDSRAKGYKSSSRHIDRSAVRYEGESGDAELDDIKRQLASSSSMLDRSAEDYARKTREDEELEQELDDLKYRVRRVKEDIDYVSKGKRTPEKDEERRKLERELLYLMHERLPEVERKQREVEERRKREERDGVKARDRRNETYGRYDGGGGSRYDRDDDRDRYRPSYGSQDRSRERDSDRRDTYDRDERPRRGSREEYDSYAGSSSRRPASPPGRRSPPREAPREPESRISAPPPAPAPPTSVAAAAPATKNMTPEERKAHIQAQAQARIQARMRALGMGSDTPAESSNGIDNSVQERLDREKKEAEERSRSAEKEQEDREAKRRARLEGSGAPSATFAPAPPAPPANAPIKSAMKKPGPPPPPPSKKAASAPTPRVAAPAPPAPAARSAPEEDEEDAELRAKEEAHKKSMADRQARLKRMQEEEEAAQREEEALLQRKKQAAAQLREEETPEAPPAPPPMPHSTSGSSSTNPFHRMQNGSAAASPPVASPSTAKAGGFNPFLKPQGAAAAAAAPTPSPSEEAAPPAPPAPPPAPPAPVPTQPAFTAPRSAPTSARPAFAPADEEWDVIGEKDDSGDSSDDDYAGSRSQRGDLARALFGGIMPGGSRPGSADNSRPSSATAEKKPAPAALAKLGGGDPMSRGGLFAAIQSGAKLRKTQTVDKTAAPGAGKVIGDASPPTQSAAAPPPAAPTSPEENDETDRQAQRAQNRQSVDWYQNLASDADAEDRRPAHSQEQHSMPSMAEEEEEPQNSAGKDDQEDPLADFDMTHTILVRTLYPYEGQRDVDLTFGENLVLRANKAKDPSSAWWYGTIVKDGHAGWFPNSYVQELQTAKATAKYAYTGNSDEELPFAEGDELNIVDQSDADWFKAEKDGVVFIVPAAYLEMSGEKAAEESTHDKQRPETALPALPIEPSLGAAPVPAPSIVQHAPEDSDTDNDSDSSEDSFLSFEEDEADPSKSAQTLEADREQRERERLKVLAAAGLQLRREPPGVPVRRATQRRRRPPPAAPLARNRSSTISLDPPPSTSSRSSPGLGLGTLPPPSPKLDDAYDRYSSYLDESRARPAGGRARSQSDVRMSQPRPMSTISVNSMAKGEPGSPLSASLVAGSPAKGSGSGLSGFMSRMLAQPTPERRATPLISGPMAVGPLDAPETDRGPSPNFGQTWSSLVDRSVLETMSNQERKRQEAIFELIVTEGDYVRDLQLMVEVFYASMMNMLDDKTLGIIFSNIEDIMIFNTTLFSLLEERQKASRLYISKIGDILRDQLPAVSIYKSYCVNQSQGIRVLQSVRQSNAELGSQLQKIRNENPAVRSLDLSSFLLEPMQRLTRYPLLLKQILSYTGEDQDGDDIKEAIASAERVLADVNESIRDAESQDKLAALSEELWIGGEGRLDLTAPTAYQGRRKLLKEGDVSKAKSGRKLHMVLCNDILVLIESKNLYRMPIPLHEVIAKDAPRDGASLQLVQEFARGKDSIGLKASSNREAQAWISEINRGRQSAIQARNEMAKNQRRRSSAGIGY